MSYSDTSLPQVKNFVRTMSQLDFHLYFKALSRVYAHLAILEEDSRKRGSLEDLKKALEEFAQKIGNIATYLNKIPSEQTIDLSYYYPLVMASQMENPTGFFLTFNECYLYISKLQYDVYDYSKYKKNLKILCCEKIKQVNMIIDAITSCFSRNLLSIQWKPESIISDLSSVKMQLPLSFSRTDFFTNMKHLDFYVYFKALSQALIRVEKFLVRNPHFLDDVFSAKFYALSAKLIEFANKIGAKENRAIGLSEYYPFVLLSKIEEPNSFFSTFAECYLYVSKLGYTDIDISTFIHHFQMMLSKPAWHYMSQQSVSKFSEGIEGEAKKLFSLDDVLSKDDELSRLLAGFGDIGEKNSLPRTPPRMLSPPRAASPEPVFMTTLPTWMQSISAQDHIYLNSTKRYSEVIKANPIFCAACGNKYFTKEDIVATQLYVFHLNEDGESCIPPSFKINSDYVNKIPEKEQVVFFNRCKAYIDQLPK